MEQILLDKELNKKYHDKGFVKFPLFNKEQLASIKSFYDGIESEHNIEVDKNFHTTLNTSNSNLVKRVNAFLTPFFKKELPKHLKNYKLTIAGLLVKDTGKNSAVTIHQDWTFVDEESHSAFGLWVSLSDTNIFNGCLQFIPGSHSFYPSLRISPDIPGYFQAYKDEAAKYLIDVPSKAGECVMFNQATLHASRKNISQRKRIACIMGGYSANADLLHYFRPQGSSLSQIEKHKIQAESMLELKKDQRPNLSKFLEIVDYTPPKTNLQEFKKKCKPHISSIYVLKNIIVNQFLGKSS